MDAELKELFGMIIGKLDSLDEKVGTLDQKVGTLDQKVGTLDQKVGALDQKVTRNSIDIESIKWDIKTIVEVQKAYIEKNERDHEEIITLINHEIGLHSAILKNVSSDVRGLEEDQRILEREVLSIKRKIG